MRILIRGYYGFGNLGDDLLCKTSLVLIHEKYPEAELKVLSFHPNAGYVTQLVPFQVTVVNKLNYSEYDKIIFGGGGIFFDYHQGSLSDLILNKIIKFVGYRRYSLIYNRLKSWRNGLKCLPDHTAIGVGVGNFTPSSRKLQYKIPEMHSCSHIFIRDTQSRHKLAQFGYNNVVEVSDLVFFREKWISGDWEYTEAKNKIAIVLRDWEFDNSAYLVHVKEMIDQLIKSDYLITIISFDQEHDRTVQSFARKHNFELMQYDPDNYQPDNFALLLTGFNLILSARAHGLILAASLLIPSIGIELENKIRMIASLLPNGCRLISSNAVPVNICEIVAMQMSLSKKEIELDYHLNLKKLDRIQSII